MSCKELVSNHPEAFQEAYWSIRRLETYQWQATSNSASTVAPSSAGSQSCNKYGCHSAFDPSHACQCDTECLSYGNCCDDVAEVCGVHNEAAPNVFRSAFVEGGAKRNKLRTQAPPVATCSAYPACAHLDEDCCPTKEGMMLDCCAVDLHSSSPASFRRTVLTFMKRFQTVPRGLPRSPSFLAHPLMAVAVVTVAACSFAVAHRTAAAHRRHQPHDMQAAHYLHMTQHDSQENLCADQGDARELQGHITRL